MNFIEFIGFIVTIMAMFFILIKRSWDERRRRTNPEDYQQQEEDREKALKEFLRSLNVETFEEPLPAPPPDMPEPKLASREIKRIESDNEPEIEEVELKDYGYLPKSDVWGAVGKKRSTRLQKILKHLNRPGDIVIYREVLGKPKAFQNHILPHDLSEW